MKRLNSQEPTADLSRSDVLTGIEFEFQVPSGSNSRATSAAMLGLALSMSASGVLLANGEASAAIDLQSVTKASELTPDPLPAAAVETGSRIYGDVTSETQYHTVEAGDSLWQIAQNHQVEVSDIKVANRIEPDTLLQVGQVLKVPADTPEAKGHDLSVLVSLSSQAASAEQAASDLADHALVAETASHRADGTSEAKFTAHSRSSVAAIASLEPQAGVVSMAAVTQEDSLRSAGLVSPSEGFQQELSRMEVAANTMPSEVSSAVRREANIPVVATLVPLNPQTNYRVRPGDTLASIANTFGLTSKELIEANGINDPNLIVAGQTLALPQRSGVATEPTVPVVLTAIPEPVATKGTRLARLQSTAERQVNASRLLERLQAETGDAPTVAVTTDPYAANLVSQVAVAREQSTNQSVTQPDWVATETSKIAEASPVNPEFASSRGQVTQVAIAPTASQTQAQNPLLAAAPLGPDAYLPIRQPAAGQIVSPELPILPAASEYLPETPSRFNGYIWPSRGTLTSGFGPRWGRRHQGIDIAAPVGTPVMAAASGTIEQAGWNSGGYGNVVDIRHPDGSMTRYGHNSRLLVRAGQQVAQGQQIAEMGSTGYSTGPHVHFEIHLPNQGAVNPMAYLPSR